jgi:hypothetical protein
MSSTRRRKAEQEDEREGAEENFRDMTRKVVTKEEER